MNTMTTTPTATPRTDAAWSFAFTASEFSAASAARQMRDKCAELETELAAAKAECNRLYESSPTALDALTAELARLRAENLTAHQMACAAGLERDQLRADLERFTGHGLLDCHAICDQRDAAVAERDQLRAEVSEARRAWLGDDYGHLPLIEALEKFRSDSDAESDRADVLYQRSCEVEHALRAEVEQKSNLLVTAIKSAGDQAARAERAEAALAEWSVLNLWGGTPEIIHEFIKGQQNRIHHCQNLEAECLEQARLLGMSGEREADLLGKLERLAKDKARLDWLEDHGWITGEPCDRAAIDAAMKP